MLKGHTWYPSFNSQSFMPSTGGEPFKAVLLGAIGWVDDSFVSTIPDGNGRRVSMELVSAGSQIVGC
ncbi:hypothetical protein N7488_004221 [Penicillium malachiteum]|nr:hypothetical protein N7488_004221 [Penicillium malachiteum]